MHNSTFSRFLTHAAFVALIGFGLTLPLTTLGCGAEVKCQKDFDCPATQVCNVNSGQCEQFVCDVDEDCQQVGAVCLENRCQTVTAASEQAR